MAVKHVEALADAIAYLNKAHDPSSDAYQLRNPGMFRVYSFKHLNSSDSRGRRIFTSLIGGYRFLIQDLTWKCSGETRAKGVETNGIQRKLKPSSSLADLLAAFKLNNEENLFTLIDFLVRSLHDESINSQTEISYFLKDDENGRSIE
jgi:hypothetical protein